MKTRADVAGQETLLHHRCQPPHSSFRVTFYERAPMCQLVAEFAHGAISARGVCATPCRAGRRCRRHRRVGGLVRIVRERAPWLLDTAANGTAPNGPSHLTPPHIRYSHSMLTFLGIWVFMMVVMGITLRGIIFKSSHRFSRASSRMSSKRGFFGGGGGGDCSGGDGGGGC